LVRIVDSGELLDDAKLKAEEAEQLHVYSKPAEVEEESQ